MLKKHKPLLISVGLAFLALLLGASYIKNFENKLLDASRPIPVLKAVQDIQKNMPIEEQMLAVEEVPQKYVQPGALNHPNDAIGRLAESPIQKGEQIVGTKLITWGTETGLAVKVPAGKRAVSIHVDETTGVGGLIKPDNYVDVVGSFNFGDQSKDSHQAHTLLQDVRVLAVSRDLGVGLARKEKGANDRAEGGRSDDKTTVTLALDPQEVQDIILAQQAGELTLSLRSLSETDKTFTLKPSTINSLTGMQEKTMAKQGYRQYRGR